MSQPYNPQPVDPAGQQAFYGQPMYAPNPIFEQIRSNAATIRLLSFVSFLVGGLILSGAMWAWSNNLVSQAQANGAPMDVTAQIESSRSIAKTCSIVHIVFLVLGIVMFVGFLILVVYAEAAGSRY